jgi:hypothetical protein
MPRTFQGEPFLKKLRADHRELDQELLKIRGAFQNALNAPAGSPERRRLMEALQSLREMLVRHFEEEEGEGCLWEAASFNTSLCGEVKKVLGEHPEMLKRLDAIIEAVKNGAKREDWGAPARQEFDQLARILAEHEAREAAILESSFPMA